MQLETYVEQFRAARPESTKAFIELERRISTFHENGWDESCVTWIYPLEDESLEPYFPAEINENEQFLFTREPLSRTDFEQIAALPDGPTQQQALLRSGGAILELIDHWYLYGETNRSEVAAALD